MAWRFTHSCVSISCSLCMRVCVCVCLRVYNFVSATETVADMFASASASTGNGIGIGHCVVSLIWMLLHSGIGPPVVRHPRLRPGSGSGSGSGLALTSSLPCCCSHCDCCCCCAPFQLLIIRSACSLLQLVPAYALPTPAWPGNYFLLGRYASSAVVVVVVALDTTQMQIECAFDLMMHCTNSVILQLQL